MAIKRNIRKGAGRGRDEKKLLPKGASEHDGETWWVCIHAHGWGGVFAKTL